MNPLGITVHMDDQSTTKYRGSDVEVSINADACPAHGPWVAKKSKRGKWFWSCTVPQGEDWCFMRPTYAWRETHPPEQPDFSQPVQVALSPAPAPTQAAPAAATPPVAAPPPPAAPGAHQDVNFDDLPF